MDDDNTPSGLPIGWLVMPDSSRHEHLAPLATALSRMAEGVGRADAELLEQQVLLGDRSVQGRVDDLVDDALEALREVATSCRELANAVAGAETGHEPQREHR